MVVIRWFVSDVYILDGPVYWKTGREKFYICIAKPHTNGKGRRGHHEDMDYGHHRATQRCAKKNTHRSSICIDSITQPPYESLRSFRFAPKYPNIVRSR